VFCSSKVVQIPADEQQSVAGERELPPAPERLPGHRGRLRDHADADEHEEATPRDPGHGMVADDRRDADSGEEGSGREHDRRRHPLLADGEAHRGLCRQSLFGAVKAPDTHGPHRFPPDRRAAN
jgi:hypothetical protein